MDRLFSIAIDGPSAAGKSTIAKAISGRTGALYLDTGAMYRAIGLYMLRRGIDPWDVRAVVAALGEPSVDVSYVEGTQHVFLNGEDVSGAIREHRVSDAASAVSAVPEVRERLVAMQQEIAAGKSVVMDGRDIGTKVLPNATLKIYLVADPKVRAERRHKELLEKGQGTGYDEVLGDILRRDYNDSHRAASPLCMALDAIEIDSSELGPDQVADKVIALLKLRIGGEKI